MVDAGLRLISIMFQFHKGTIKPVVCKELQMVLQCFNSIKVRLNRNIRSFILQLDRRFNSIKVRLNPASSTDACEPKQFQFHKGTIKPTQLFYSAISEAVSIP